MSEQTLILFDTTLRDGEQAPGFHMNLEEKLQVAAALARLGVDVIEAGFPAASAGDFESVEAIATRVHGVTVAGLARCIPGDIERCKVALAPAEKQRIHVFLATSPVHREHKLAMSTERVLQTIRKGVSLARSTGVDVEFSAEDAARTEPEFLAEVVEAAIDAGATTINLPDTVGYAMPHEIEQMFRAAREVVGDRAILSAHCHDDLGLALANSLAAIRGGARQIECTINGIGERAGNCALEELVMAIRTRPAVIPVATSVQAERLCATSRVIVAITGQPVAPNKAVVGANAFAHESGIHQHGMLASSLTYEIMRPEAVGATGSKLVLGKHSGRHALRRRIDELGYDLDEDAFERLFAAFKSLADRKKEISDGDIEALAVDRGVAIEGPWTLSSLLTSAGTNTLSTASVSMLHAQNGSAAEAAIGDGPIDATFKAIVRTSRIDSARLLDFQVHAVTGGHDAQGRVTVEVEFGPRKENVGGGARVRGHGISIDIVEASAYAIVDAINRHLRTLETASLDRSETPESLDSRTAQTGDPEGVAAT